MDKEKIEKGHELLQDIKSIQATKAALGIVDNLELRNRPVGNMIDIYPEGNGTNLRNSKLPGELIAAINEEAIRFIQRCKRRCEELENKTKQELEDL